MQTDAGVREPPYAVRSADNVLRRHGRGELVGFPPQLDRAAEDIRTDLLVLGAIG